MKILKHGEAPQSTTDWSKAVECTGDGHAHKGCGVVLAVEAADLYYSGKGGSRRKQISFTCANCLCETEIEGVPPSVQVRPNKGAPAHLSSLSR